MTKTYNENLNISLENRNRLLYRISNALLKVGNLQIILDGAADETILSMDACVVSILLYDKEENELVTKIIKRRDGDQRKPQRVRFQIGEGAAGLAAKKKEIVYLPDIEKSSIFVGKPRGEAGSLICVPMISQKELIGVLNVSFKKGKALEKSEKEFLIILSTIIAGSIKNSQLVGDIRKENNLLNSVIENSGEGIIVLDRAGKVLITNNYVKEALSLDNKDISKQEGLLLAKKLGILGYTKKILGVINRNERDKRLYDELEIILPSGEKKWFGLITSFICDEMGRISKVVNVSRDIASEKKLIQTKNDLVTTATHELRTPLTAIRGYLSMIQDNTKQMDEKQVKYLNKAYTSTERLSALVEDLLSTLKIDENKINLDLVDFDISSVILESIHNLNSKASHKRIEINYNPSQIFAHGDPVKSKHVIENLIDNAIKYTPINGKITVSIKSQTHNVQVEVKDNGVGIPHKYSSMIFDKFTRVNNALSVKAGGTGLGLYIAKSLVEKQGGRIWVESKQKVGTTFYFTIPSPLSFNQQNNI